MTNGRKLDIDRLVDGLNGARLTLRWAVLPVLRETFPDILWTLNSRGELDAEIVSLEYRP